MEKLERRERTGEGGRHDERVEKGGEMRRRRREQRGGGGERK